MARRAIIGINRRVGSLKPPRVRGVGGGRSSEVSFAPTDPTLPPELELEVDEVAKVQKVNGLRSIKNHMLLYSIIRKTLRGKDHGYY